MPCCQLVVTYQCFIASIHAAACSGVMSTGVRSVTPVLAASGCWLAWLPVVCCALLHAVVWILHHIFGLFFRLLASYWVHNRAGKAMSNCNNKFCDFDLRLACFCMQAVHIVECIGVENCPIALGIALICHCGLGIVDFMCHVPMVLK